MATTTTNQPVNATDTRDMAQPFIATCINAEYFFPQSMLASGCRSVLHATDTESSRYALGCVLIELHPDCVVFVATDGRRMAWRRFDHETGLDESIGMLIPNAAARQLAAMFSGTTRNAVVNVAGSRVAVSWRNGRRKDRVTTFELGEGRFPQWRQCIPDPATFRAWVAGPVGVLRDAFAPTELVQVGINGALEVSRPVSKFKLERQGEIEFSIDRSYVADWLGALVDTERASIHVVDANTAVYCAAATCHALIMPCEHAQSDKRRRRR